MTDTNLTPSEWNLKPVFLHLRSSDAGFYTLNIQRNFSRLPQIGEEIAATPEDFYEVESVVHIAFDDTDFSAEIYAKKMTEPTYTRLVGEAIDKCKRSATNSVAHTKTTEDSTTASEPKHP